MFFIMWFSFLFLARYLPTCMTIKNISVSLIRRWDFYKGMHSAEDSDKSEGYDVDWEIMIIRWDHLTRWPSNSECWQTYLALIIDFVDLWILVKLISNIFMCTQSCIKGHLSDMQRSFSWLQFIKQSYHIYLYINLTTLIITYCKLILIIFQTWVSLGYLC